MSFSGISILIYPIVVLAGVQPGRKTNNGPKCSGRTVTVEPVVALIFNVREVADPLGIGPRTVWRLVDPGELPSPLVMGGRRLGHGPTSEAFIKAKADATLNGTGEGRP